MIPESFGPSQGQKASTREKSNQICIFYFILWLRTTPLLTEALRSQFISPKWLNYLLSAIIVYESRLDQVINVETFDLIFAISKIWDYYQLV